MSLVDWAVMVGILGFIGIFGAWKTRQNASMKEYFATAGDTPWYAIGISVLATQASAITFLSIPGQAFDDGLKYVQLYFGMPIAVLVVVFIIVPRFQRSGVLTAYEYLETKLDRKTRQLAALLFLIQRGLAAGITIYAPAIVLSKVLQVDLQALNIAIGVFVTLYTVLGGSRAVNYTQFLQVAIIFLGMLAAFVAVVLAMPPGVGFIDSLRVAGALDKLRTVDFSFDMASRYTLWSGLAGGFFLSLSYFGTDQSQVGRYLTSKSTRVSQQGLLFNALVKVPMQFSILLLGSLVFVYYLFVPPPLVFDGHALTPIRAGESAERLAELESRHSALFLERKELAQELAGGGSGESRMSGSELRNSLRESQRRWEDHKAEIDSLIAAHSAGEKRQEIDFVFVTFITQVLPVGMIGLLFAAIICAGMSSTSGEINALASTSMVDFYRRSFRPAASERELLIASRLLTLAWGVLATIFAISASHFDNLIEAVNIIGSLFYGTILGIFLCAFFGRGVRGGNVFAGALIAEGAVIALFLRTDIGFLWFNVIGCGLTVLVSYLLAFLTAGSKTSGAAGK